MVGICSRLGSLWVALGGLSLCSNVCLVLGVVGCGLGLPGFGALSCFGRFKRFDPLWVGDYTGGGVFVALRGQWARFRAS